MQLLLLLAAYPWGPATDQPLERRIPPPPGFTRVKAEGFGAWLRGLPLKPGRPEVKLFDGRLARYKLPRRVAFVDALPKSAIGKVQKFEVRKILGS